MIVETNMVSGILSRRFVKFGLRPMPGSLVSHGKRVYESRVGQKRQAAREVRRSA